MRKAHVKDLDQLNKEHAKKYNELLDEKAESEGNLRQKAKTELAQERLTTTL